MSQIPPHPTHGYHQHGAVSVAVSLDPQRKFVDKLIDDIVAYNTHHGGMATLPSAVLKIITKEQGDRWAMIEPTDAAFIHHALDLKPTLNAVRWSLTNGNATINNELRVPPLGVILSRETISHHADVLYGIAVGANIPDMKAFTNSLTVDARRWEPAIIWFRI